MINEYRKHADRRHKSAIKPLLFLMMEFLVLVLVCILVIFKLDNMLLEFLIVLASLYFFITSSLKRYRVIKERQKFYEE